MGIIYINTLDTCGALFRSRDVAQVVRVPLFRENHRKVVLRMTPKTPPELDLIADVVLNYKPKPKTKAQRKRARKAKKNAKARY